MYSFILSYFGVSKKRESLVVLNSVSAAGTLPQELVDNRNKVKYNSQECIRHPLRVSFFNTFFSELTALNSTLICELSFDFAVKKLDFFNLTRLYRPVSNETANEMRHDVDIINSHIHDMFAHVYQHKSTYRLKVHIG